MIIDNGVDLACCRSCKFASSTHYFGWWLRPFFCQHRWYRIHFWQLFSGFSKDTADLVVIQQWGQTIYQKFLYLPQQFSLNLCYINIKAGIYIFGADADMAMTTIIFIWEKINNISNTWGRLCLLFLKSSGGCTGCGFVLKIFCCDILGKKSAVPQTISCRVNSLSLAAI